MSVSRNYTGCGPLPPQVVAVLPQAEEVAEHCARTVFASQWGDAIERAATAERYPEREESERDAAPEGFEVPSLSGCDLLDVAPHDERPARFLAFARDAVAQLVSALFEDGHTGARLLDKLRDADAEELGHTLALDVLGTGAADWSEHDAEEVAEYAPTMDCDGRLYLSLGEVWEPAELSDADLRKLTPRPLNLLDPLDPRNAAPGPEFYAALREAIDADDIEAAAELLRRDVETLTLPDDDDTRLEYVNAGDTYTDTLTRSRGVFRVQSWGAAVEHAEEVRTFTTGETRCGACSEWGDRRDGSPCEHCGHTD